MKIILAIILGLAFSVANAQDFSPVTSTEADGTVVTKIPVTEMRCLEQNKANYANAALGAGVGYASGTVAKEVLGSRSSAWGLAGAAVGALIGANTQTETTCNQTNVLVGYRLIKVKDGKVEESFETVPQK